MSDKHIWLIDMGDEIAWCDSPYPSDSIEKEDVTGYTRNDVVEEELAKANTRIEEQQAIIDSLVLEYCPDEMTKEQMDNWKKHQILAKEITSKEGA